MRKRGAVLLLTCSMIACMLTSGAQAAPSALNQAVARNLAESLRADLQVAEQQPELAPLVNSTYVLLDALEAALANKDVEAMRVAVEQYAEEVQFFRAQAEAEAVSLKCTLPLVIGIAGKIPTLLGIVIGGGTPLCIFINLSNNITDILSSIMDYQICVVDNDNNTATDNATLVRQQKGVDTLAFITTVLNLAICKRPLAVTDLISPFFEFLGLIRK